MSLCGHTSIIALFRFELQNNFSIPVELRITYLLLLWSNERDGTQIAHRQHTDIPNIVSLTAVLVSHISCRHLSARSSNPAFSRQHTNSMCVDIGTQYPHKHHATFTLFPKSNILDSIKIAIFSRRLADFRRGLIDASHLGSHAGLSKN